MLHNPRMCLEEYLTPRTHEPLLRAGMTMDSRIPRCQQLPDPHVRE